jgi:putative transcriptional regulator
MENDLDIKSLRESLGQTQAEFAANLGVDQGTVSNWEKRKTKPSGPARKIMRTLAPSPERAAS